MRRNTVEKRKAGGTPWLGRLALVALLAAAGWAQAQGAKTTYSTMAPLDQYMMDRKAEIAMALSAGPESISKDATVMVLSPHGYETVTTGKNGFVCMVERGWTASFDDPVFWNPKVRGPICLNPPAVRTYLPLTIKRTELVLAGRTKAQIQEAIESGIEKKQLPLQEPGAMSYMMSKQGYLGDGVGHWHPHVMFFVPLGEPSVWGADGDDSPIMESKDASERLVIYMMTVGKWSDGTNDAM